MALGARFGDLTNYSDDAPANAFDSRATRLVEAFINAELLPLDPKVRLVYPFGEASIDLRACLTAARVQYPSRLGIGIRPDCGTWFAVRAAAATTLSDAHRALLLEYYPPLAVDDGGPCTTCSTTPCRPACPVKAVATTLDLTACMAQRLEPDSTCESRCNAREACPVGREFMYSRSQVAYHYAASLRMIKRWSQKQ